MRRAGSLVGAVGRLGLGRARLARPPTPAQGGDARREAARARASPRARSGTRSAPRPAGWDAPSPTAPNSDTFQAHGASLAELEHAFPLEPGPVRRAARARRQPLPRLGLAPGRVPAAVAEAPPRLPARRARGARRAGRRRKPRSPASSRRSATRERARQPSAGLGEDVRLRGSGVIGSGLELDGELLQLSAFTSDAAPSGRSGGSRGRAGDANWREDSPWLLQPHPRVNVIPDCTDRCGSGSQSLVTRADKADGEPPAGGRIRAWRSASRRLSYDEADGRREPLDSRRHRRLARAGRVPEIGSRRRTHARFVMSSRARRRHALQPSPAHPPHRFALGLQVDLRSPGSRARRRSGCRTRREGSRRPPFRPRQPA